MVMVMGEITSVHRSRGGSPAAAGAAYAILLWRDPIRLWSQHFLSETWIEKYDRHLVMGFRRVAICRAYEGCGNTDSTVYYSWKCFSYRITT
jgi:hypothetical protein